MKTRRIQWNNRTVQITIVLVLILSLLLLRGAVNRLVQYVAIPFVGAGTWITQTIGLSSDLRDVTRAQLEQFQKEHVELALLKTRFHTLEREHEQLTKSLGFIEGRGHFPVGASVVSRASSNERSRLVLNRGSDDGVFVGAPVIVEDGLYVGKIVQVTNTQSVVSTLTDQDHATAVSLLNETETIGLVHGLTGNLTMLEFIPLEEEVDVDNLAVTSGLEEFVPSGLLVGFVNTVRPDPNGPFQQAIVEPIVDIRRYTQVIILLPLEV